MCLPLKIVFLTSCLEPGRDGVGDYTRRLAAECIRQGHPGVILALNDSYITQSVIESQEREGVPVPVLRLPPIIPWRDRLVVARKYLEEFKPDWISLQYVCYGYHRKGLAWCLNPVVAELGRLAKRRHIMFHELWIGPPPLHRWLVGTMQKWMIQDLHRRFRPNIVTTSICCYQHRLSKCGIIADILPLYGNISLAVRDDDAVLRLLQTRGSMLTNQPRSHYWVGVFFGIVHPYFDAEPLFRWLAELRERPVRKVILILIGRPGAAAEQLIQKLARSETNPIEIVALGEQSEATISQVLQFADFGICTVTPKVLGKSGTFAAMREHGLPVVLADGDLDPTFSRDNALSVLQFSTIDSVAVLTGSSRQTHFGNGVKPAARVLVGGQNELTSA